MKPIDMIQCQECKEALKEYISKTENLTPQMKDYLAEFALYMELRRLRKAKREQLTFPPGVRSFPGVPMPDFGKPTLGDQIIC